MAVFVRRRNLIPMGKGVVIVVAGVLFVVCGLFSDCAQAKLHAADRLGEREAAEAEAHVSGAKRFTYEAFRPHALRSQGSSEAARAGSGGTASHGFLGSWRAAVATA